MATGMTSGRVIEAVFSILRLGKAGWSGLSIMADIDHNCMKRCDFREVCMVSSLMCPGELAEAYGGMNGVKSLCTGCVNEYG